MSDQNFDMPVMCFVPVALVSEGNAHYLAVADENGTLFYQHANNGVIVAQCWLVKAGFSEEMFELLQLYSFSFVNIDCDRAEVFLVPISVWVNKVISKLDNECPLSLILRKGLPNLPDMYLSADEISPDTQYMFDI